MKHVVVLSGWNLDCDVWCLLLDGVTRPTLPAQYCMFSPVKSIYLYCWNEIVCVKGSKGGSAGKDSIISFWSDWRSLKMDTNKILHCPYKPRIVFNNCTSLIRLEPPQHNYSDGFHIWFFVSWKFSQILLKQRCSCKKNSQKVRGVKKCLHFTFLD